MLRLAERFLHARVALTALAVMAGVATTAPSASALAPTTPDAGAWVPNGPVTAVVHKGSRTIVGGGFSMWGPFTGAGMRLATIASTPGLASGQSVVGGGYVLATVGDGAGGVFIGGTFSRVNSVARGGLAHITASGTLDPSFAPRVDGDISALTVTGGVLYAGGDFDAVHSDANSSAVIRRNLAAFDAATGAVTSWAPCTSSSDPTADDANTVRALATNGSAIFVGGRFTHLGLISSGSCLNLASALNLASVSAATGAQNQWDSAPNSTVRALLVVGSTLYTGGRFSSVAVAGSGPTGRSRAAAFATVGGQPTSWDPHADGDVYALAAGSSGDVFLGGIFQNVGNSPTARRALARVSGTTGTIVSSFDAGLQSSATDGLAIYAVSVAGSHVLIGGTFALGSHESLDMVDATTGANENLDVQPSGGVFALSTLSGGTAYAGGAFGSAQAVRRDGIAVLDQAGVPTSVTLSVGSYVDALAVSPDGTTIYYDTAKQSVAPTLESVGTETGVAGSWHPARPGAFTDAVYDIDVSEDGQRVYVGGHFATLGGLARTNLASTSASTGAVTAWQPDPDSDVFVVDEVGDQVYVGGKFAHIGTGADSRVAIARVATADAVTDAWAPVVDNEVRDLSISADGTRAYLVGAFTHAGSPPVVRNYAAALSTTSGNPTSFNPNLGSYAVDLALANNDNDVYVTGNFQPAVGTPGLGVFSGTDGAYTSWNPAVSPYAAIERIDVLDDNAWLGSNSKYLGAEGRPFYAQFISKPAAKTPPQINGAAVAGQVLTCAAAVWRNGPRSISVAWLRDGAAIGGATLRTYLLGADDVGHQIVCQETATNQTGGITLSASAPVTVAAAPVEPGGGTSGTSGGTVDPGAGSEKPTTPPLPTTPAALKLTAKPKAAKFASAKGSSLLVTLSAAATVKVVVTKCPAKGVCKKPKKAQAFKVALKAGAGAVVVGDKKNRLSAGKYVVTVTAYSLTGAAAGPVSMTLTVTT